MKKFYFLIVLVASHFIPAEKILAQCFVVTVPDYATTRSGMPILIDVVANDTSTLGNSVVLQNISTSYHATYEYQNGKVLYKPNFSFVGLDTVRYSARDALYSYSKNGFAFVTVTPGKNFDSVYASNINAAVNSDGTLFWDYEAKCYFEVPKGSGKNTLYMQSLMVTGKDPLDSLHYSGGEYFQDKHFFPGPVSNVYDSLYRERFYRTWKVTKAQVENHQSNWWTWGYTPPEAIANWPAHGKTALGQAQNLAPFFDYDGDGFYNPMQGDYPLIRGDEALLFIFSDGQSKENRCNGKKLDVDVIGMLYAFHCPDDSALWNSIFLNYQILNRSTVTYHDLYLGFFSDLDIGFPDDDYIGCDVQRAAFYAYNAREIDGSGKPCHYGSNPPVQGEIILKGPEMDADGIDNPAGIDDGINGFGFGDGIDDNECFGLSKLMYTIRPGTQVQWIMDPQDARSYYYCMRTDTLCFNHGMSYPDTTACSPMTRFAFPDNSDSLHWGTNYQEPSCYPDNWTEDIVNYPMCDQRCIPSFGPMTLLPGMKKEMDIAFVYARNFTDSSHRAAIPIMLDRMDMVKKYYINDYTPCGQAFFNHPLQQEPSSVFRVFPNPATNQLIFEITNAENNSVVTITDLFGNKIMSNNLNNKMSGSFDISGLSRGMYLISILKGNKYLSKKFVKL